MLQNRGWTSTDWPADASAAVQRWLPPKAVADSSDSSAQVSNAVHESASPISTLPPPDPSPKAAAAPAAPVRPEATEPAMETESVSSDAALPEQSSAPSAQAYFESQGAVRRFLAEESEHELKVRPTQLADCSSSIRQLNRNVVRCVRSWQSKSSGYLHQLRAACVSRDRLHFRCPNRYPW